jgi:hypothetical protein
MPDHLAIQSETPQTLSALVAGLPPETLTRRPAPNKWSILEIIAHLAEDELVSSWRYRQMLQTPGVLLPGFDQDQWARFGKYETWPPADALAMFRLLREANLRMFANLTPEEWQRQGNHGERGPLTVATLARHMAGHDQNHLNQIRQILNTPD